MPRFHLLSKVVGQEAANNIGGAFLHISGGVRIGVEGEAGLCMAQDASQRFGIDAGGKGVSGEGVPDIMKANVRETCFF